MIPRLWGELRKARHEVFDPSLGVYCWHAFRLYRGLSLFGRILRFCFELTG